MRISMPGLSERQKEILLAVVGEYIRTGEPVSSSDLCGRYRFGYSPATIRNELLTLTETGYLAQPHTSAGRIPTDAGYRWYVDKIEERRPQHDSLKMKRGEKHQIENLDEYDDIEEFFRASTELLAGIGHGLAIGGSLGDADEPLYKSGFGEILGDAEFLEPESRGRFGLLMDSIDEEMRGLARSHDLVEPQVFIGDENPIREARRYSMLVRQITRDGTLGIIAIIGPKRMRYEGALHLLRALGAPLDNL